MLYLPPTVQYKRTVAQRRQSARAEQERALLDELKRVAEALGIRVREEPLLREVGYRVRSGACRVRDTDLLLLDRAMPISAQLDVLVDVLAGRAIGAIYLSPAARHLIERRGTPTAAAGT